MRHRREHSVPSEEMKALLAQLVDEEYCYVTTTGRVSGGPHEIEIWFGVSNGALYLLSGGGENSDWVKNMRKIPSLQSVSGNIHFREQRASNWMRRKRPGHVTFWLQSIRAGVKATH